MYRNLRSRKEPPASAPHRKESPTVSKKKVSPQPLETTPPPPAAANENIPESKAEVENDTEVYNSKGQRIPKLTIKIEEWRAVANWRWKCVEEDDCTICRSSYSACCNDCKFPGEECPIVVGKCTHTYHGHCIKKWMDSQGSQQRQTCPLCRLDWVIVSDGSQTTTS